MLCRCYHPSWLDKSQRIPLWGLPDLNPKDARMAWLSGEQVFTLRGPCLSGWIPLYSIAALFWRREARRLVLSGRSQQRICFRESDSPYSIPWPWTVCVVGTSQQYPSWYILMFETVVQRSLSKTHVISNHAAKLESKCAVFLRSQKKFWKKWFFCKFRRLRVDFSVIGLILCCFHFSI